MNDSNGVGGVAGKAITVAESFYLSWGLNAKLGQKGQMTVEGLSVLVSNDPTADSGKADVVLDGRVLVGRSVAEHVEECNKVLAKLGLQPRSVERPQTGAIRAKTTDYHEVVMRLTQFRRTANPTRATLDEVASTIQREAQRAARLYSTVVQKMNYDWEDLQTIGYVYFINHWHQYRDPTKSKDANEKYFVKHLQQQYGRWAQVTNAMLRSCLFKNSGLPVDEYMSTPAPGLRIAHDTVGEPAYEMDHDAARGDLSLVHIDDEATDKWERKERAATNREQRAARKSARAALDSALSTLGHDRMVFELRRVVKDEEHQDFAARKLAKSIFDKHAKECEGCRKMVAVEEKRAEQEERFLTKEEKLQRFISGSDLDEETEAA